MRAPSIICDGLWRCLCPSFDSIASFRPLLLLPHLNPTLITTIRARPRPQCRRRLSPGRRTYATEPEQAHADAHDQARGRRRSRPPSDRLAWRRNLFTCPPGQIVAEARLLSLEGLRRALPRLVDQSDGYVRMIVLLPYLLHELAIQPDEQLYEILIASMAHQNGSAHGVGSLLAEMDKELVSGGRSGPFRAALRALAAHPDYVLRSRILHKMKSSRIQLAMSDHEHVVLGLLRDGQLELALEKLDSILVNEARLEGEVSAWVLEVFAVVFADAGCHDEALHILLHLLRGSSPAPRRLLMYLLLDAFSRAYHYAGTKYVWDRTERAASLGVPDGTVANVLATAARHGDARLATQAIQHLVARRARVSAHHYEALVDMYAEMGAVADGLRTLCIMSKAGVSATRESTRLLYRAMAGDRELLDDAVGCLVQLSAEYAVPAAAGSVLVEATLATLGLGPAMDTYRTLRRHLGSSPVSVGLETFSPLVEHATDPLTLAALAVDFVAAAIPRPAPAWFYDKLAWGCALAGDDVTIGYILLDKIRTLPPPSLAPPPPHPSIPSTPYGPPASAPPDHPDPPPTRPPPPEEAGRRQAEDWWMAMSSVPPLLRRGLAESNPRATELAEALEKSPAGYLTAAAAREIKPGPETTAMGPRVPGQPKGESIAGS